MTKKVHKLKIWPVFFKELLNGNKTFEVRKSDRGFCVGDELLLEEYDMEYDDWNMEKGYTGNSEKREITYILPGGAWGIEPGYVVLGLKTI